MWASKLLGIIGGTLLCSLLDYVGYVTKALHGHLGTELASASLYSGRTDALRAAAVQDTQHWTAHARHSLKAMDDIRPPLRRIPPGQG
jgi:hypothetical protein